MLGQVRTNGRPEEGGAAGARGGGHVAVLTARNERVVAAESPAHVDGSLGEVAEEPFGVGALLGEHVDRPLRRVGLVHRVEGVGAVGLAGVDGVGDFVAGRAHGGLLVEVGLQPGVVRCFGRDHEGPAPAVEGVDDVRPIVRIDGRVHQAGENGEVFGRADAGLVDGVDHAMADDAGDAFKVKVVELFDGLGRAAVHVGHRRVAAETGLT